MACVPPQISYLLDITGVGNRNICEVSRRFEYLSNPSTPVIRGVEIGKYVLVMLVFKFKKSHEAALVVIRGACLVALHPFGGGPWPRSQRTE